MANLAEKRDALLACRDCILCKLEAIAHNFDELERNANIAKITIASFGMVTNLVTLGSLVAAPFTCGTSLALAQLSMSIGAACVASGTCTSVVYLIIIKNLCSEVKKLLELNEKASKELEYEINKQLCKSGVQFGKASLQTFGSACAAYEIVSTGALKNITFSTTRSAINITKIGFVVATGTCALTSVEILLEIIYTSKDIERGSIIHASQLRNTIKQLKQNTNELRAVET